MFFRFDFFSVPDTALFSQSDEPDPSPKVKLRCEIFMRGSDFLLLRHAVI